MGEELYKFSQQLIGEVTKVNKFDPTHPAYIFPNIMIDNSKTNKYAIKAINAGITISISI